MAHDDGLNSLVSEGSYLNVALLCVRDGQHASAFTVESAQAIRVIARVQAVNQRQVGEIVNIGLNCEHYDDTKDEKRINPGLESE